MLSVFRTAMCAKRCLVLLAGGSSREHVDDSPENALKVASFYGDSSRRAGTPYLVRSDVNSWNIDINVKVEPAMVDISVSTINVVGAIGVGHEVTIVGRDENACVVGFTDGGLEVDFLIAGSDSVRLVRPSEIRRATRPLQKQCSGRTLRCFSSKLVSALLSFRLTVSS